MVDEETQSIDVKIFYTNIKMNLNKLIDDFIAECKNAMKTKVWDIPYQIILSIKNYEDMLHFKQFLDKNSTHCLNIHKECNVLDLYEIIYHCFNEDQQKKIVNYINIICPMWKKESLIHIISDIDDTLFPGKIGGEDKTDLQKDVFYPGVIDFHKHVRSTDYTTLLTIRPKFLKSYMLKNSNYIKNLKLFNIISTTSTVQFAADSAIKYSASNVKKYMFRSKCTLPENISIYKKWGNIKFKAFSQYKNIFPEYKLVFIGDSGQGDIVTAKLINKMFPHYTCLIHNVMYNHLGYRYYDINCRKKLEEKNIYLFDSYKEACSIALSLNLLTPLQAQKIYKAVENGSGA